MPYNYEGRMPSNRSEQGSYVNDQPFLRLLNEEIAYF